MSTIIDFTRLKNEKTQRARAATQDAIRTALAQADTIDSIGTSTGVKVGDTQHTTLQFLERQAGEPNTNYLDLLAMRVTVADLDRQTNEHAVTALESTLSDERGAARYAADAFEANEQKIEVQQRARSGTIGGVAETIPMIGFWIAVIFTIITTFRMTGAAIDAASPGSKLLALLFTPITSFITAAVVSLIALAVASGLAWVAAFVAIKISEGRARAARQERTLHQQTKDRESDRRQRKLADAIARLRSLRSANEPLPAAADVATASGSSE